MCRGNTGKYGEKKKKKAGAGEGEMCRQEEKKKGKRRKKEKGARGEGGLTDDAIDPIGLHVGDHRGQQSVPRHVRGEMLEHGVLGLVGEREPRGEARRDLGLAGLKHMPHVLGGCRSTNLKPQFGHNVGSQVPIWTKHRNHKPPSASDEPGHQVEAITGGVLGSIAPGVAQRNA